MVALFSQIYSITRVSHLGVVGIGNRNIFPKTFIPRGASNQQSKI
jgi:hypothetical protein